MRLAVIGHVEWVTFGHAPFVPRAGQIVHVDDLLDQAGGGGAVTAIALARMGAEVTFYTALGTDVPAQAVLESFGVQVYAAHRNHPQTRVLALVDPDGERTLYVIGPNDHPTADDPLPWDELERMDGVYFTGYDPRTLRLARRAPVVVVTARRFRALVQSGIHADALVGSSTDPGEQFDLAELAERPAHVIVTQGARGGTGYAAAAVPGPVVDTYGAGDTFVAGVTYGLSAGWDIDRTLHVAAERAAECLTWRGVYPPAPVPGRPSG